LARRAKRPPIGLALAGGGPFGAIYEIGALAALEECVEGLDLNRLDCYVGVSAGGFLAAALANGVPIREIHALAIEGRAGEGAFGPEIFMRPAFGEYARRARSLPRLLLRSLWGDASLGAAIPTGLFDNASIQRYLQAAFSAPGRSDDFRQLERRLYVVATDLDTGAAVTFGRPGHDHVPISKAVQASCALPGLFPPVEIGGRSFVDGALRKTLHASEALDDGAKLVLCVNPIVPYDAEGAAASGKPPHARLVDGGLPVVLAQTLRAVIHSRLTVGLSKYRTQYRGADVVLFEPDASDSDIFFTSLFGYAMRRRVCEHAYRRTRQDLLRRAPALEPLLARHGLRLRRAALEDAARRLSPRPLPAASLTQAASELRLALAELRRSLGTAPLAG
jgi:predicted acylesterase/phospholipase RssA